MADLITSVPAGASESPQVPDGWTFIRDLRASAIVLILVAAANAWAAWSGNLLFAFGYVALGFVFGAPVLLVVLVLSSLSSRPDCDFIRRVAAQSLVVLVIALPLLFGGFWVESLSIRASQHRGDQIATALEAYRGAHGTYPKSLGELEQHAKVELPRPTTCSWFIYETGKDGLSYHLMFRGGGIGNLWWLNPETRVWGRVD